jgi:hypothetical protein
MNDRPAQAFVPQIPRTPDILLSGQAVEQILMACNNHIILAKTQDGSMRPFVDPTPISQIIGAALQATVVKEQPNAV